MSSDRKLQAKRREAILEILAGDQQAKEQKDLVELLQARGIPATQPSVSRDLKVLGAVRTRGYYEIPSWTDEEEEEVSPFRRVVPFVQRVRQAGPYQLLVVTDPGAGRVVSQAITEAGWEEVVGTIDSDSAVLVLTENFFFQRLVYERLKYYLRADGANEIVDLE